MINSDFILNAFGLGLFSAVKYNDDGQQLEPGNVQFDALSEGVVTSLNTGTDDTPKKSLFGTPIFSDLTLKESDDDPGLNLPVVIQTVSMRKNIKTTSVLGRSGTVKEYISNGDYDVAIKGLVQTNRADTFPLEQVKELHRLCELQSNLIVISPYLQLFNIYEIVVQSFSFSQTGFTNIQAFDISAISDTPIELIERVENGL